MILEIIPFIYSTKWYTLVAIFGTLLIAIFGTLSPPDYNSIADELNLSESTLRNKIKQGYLKKR